MRSEGEALGKPDISVSEDVAAVVAASPRPCLVMEVPSERILLANAEMEELLSPDRSSPAGHLLEEYLSEDPVGGVDLLGTGRVSSYETVRRLRRRDDVPLRLSAEALASPRPRRLALVVAREAERGEDVAAGSSELPAPLLIAGTADRDLHVDRLSAGAELVFGRAASDLLGDSLLTLVSPRDVAPLLLALAESAGSGRPIRHEVQLVGGEERFGAELSLFPLVPAPSVAFFLFLPASRQCGGRRPEDVTAELVGRLFRSEREVVSPAQKAEKTSLPGALGHGLSDRENEIVEMLLAGDRVPKIAETLYISQSTVRNHLSAVFRKLGVHSQQELIVLFRDR